MRIRTFEILFATFLMIFAAYCVNAQDSGLSFLRIGTDAKALARGDAGVATARGAFSTYWNPAGLAGGSVREIGLSHHIWVADVRTFALNSAFSIGKKSGVGFFIVATGSGDLEARTAPGESDGPFSAQFVSSGISFGRTFGAVRAGVTLKYLSERIFTNSANGYAFDFGLQSSLLSEGLFVGVTYSNLGKMQKLNVRPTELPRIGRAGIELFPFRMITALDGALLLSTSLVLEYSRNFVTDENQFHIGLSGEVLETVTARLGYISNEVLRDFSAGVGVEVTEFIFDYAFLPFEDGFGGPAHILTLTYAW